MSVIIPNMDIPIICKKCRLLSGDSLKGYFCLAQIENNKVDNIDKKPEWCPLIDTNNEPKQSQITNCKQCVLYENSTIYGWTCKERLNGNPNPNPKPEWCFMKKKK